MDMFLESSLIKLNDLKKTISQMIYKIGKNHKTTCRIVFYSIFCSFTEFEHESINWPAFLDNFALISGHVSTQHNLF